MAQIGITKAEWEVRYATLRHHPLQCHIRQRLMSSRVALVENLWINDEFLNHLQKEEVLNISLSGEVKAKPAGNARSSLFFDLISRRSMWHYGKLIDSLMATGREHVASLLPAAVILPDDFRMFEQLLPKMADLGVLSGDEVSELQGRMERMALIDEPCHVGALRASTLDRFTQTDGPDTSDQLIQTDGPDTSVQLIHPTDGPDISVQLVHTDGPDTLDKLVHTDEPDTSNQLLHTDGSDTSDQLLQTDGHDTSDQHIHTDGPDTSDPLVQTEGPDTSDQLPHTDGPDTLDQVIQTDGHDTSDQLAQTDGHATLDQLIQTDGHDTSDQHVQTEDPAIVTQTILHSMTLEQLVKKDLQDATSDIRDIIDPDAILDVGVCKTILNASETERVKREPDRSLRERNLRLLEFVQQKPLDQLYGFLEVLRSSGQMQVLQRLGYSVRKLAIRTAQSCTARGHVTTTTEYYKAQRSQYEGFDKELVAEGVKFPVHSQFIESYSPVIKDQLSKVKGHRVGLKNTSAVGLGIMLDVLYTGVLNMTPEDVRTVRQVATMFTVEGFEETFRVAARQARVEQINELIAELKLTDRVMLPKGPLDVGEVLVERAVSKLGLGKRTDVVLATRCVAVVGGCVGVGNNSGPIPAMMVAPLSPDGRLQPWVTLTTPLQVRTVSSQAVSFGPYLIIIGGEDKLNSCQVRKGVWLLSFLTSTWHQLPPMTTARKWFSVSTLPSGPAVLAVGGYDGSLPLSSCERLDLVSLTWTPVAAMPHLRAGHAAAVCGEMVYVTGGWVRGESSSTSVCTYDEVRGEWTTAPSMINRRVHHTAGSVPGRVVVCGGRDAVEVLPVEVFDTVTQQWSELTTLSRGYTLAGSVVVGNTLYVVGGSYWKEGRTFDTTRDVTVVDMVTGQVTVTDDVTLPAVANFSTVCVTDVPTSQFLGI